LGLSNCHNFAYYFSCAEDATTAASGSLLEKFLETYNFNKSFHSNACTRFYLGPFKEFFTREEPLYLVHRKEQELI
jgi:hypothetical protein